MEKPFESPPPLPRTPAAGGPRLEGRGRARLILNLRPALVCPRPKADFAQYGRGPFPDGRPDLPSQPTDPLRQPFRRAVSGPKLREAHFHPLGFPASGLVPSSGERRGSWWGCLSWTSSCANMPLGPGSPLECALGARPPGLHSRSCSQPRLQAPAGGVGRLSAWGVAHVPAEPGLQGHSWKDAAYCPPPEFSCIPILSCPIHRSRLKWA